MTDDAVLSRPDFEDSAAAVIATGSASLALHVRARHATGRRLYDLAAELVTRCERSGASLFVNDRVDVAMAARAHGVQLGSGSVRPSVVRRIAPHLIIGLSIHSEAEARSADDSDFVVAGNVYSTPTHPGRPGRGCALIERVAAATARPVVAIGGIDGSRVAPVRAAGAVAVAVISAVWGARDPGAAVGELLEALRADDGTH